MVFCNCAFCEPSFLGYSTDLFLQDMVLGQWNWTDHWWILGSERKLALDLLYVSFFTGQFVASELTICPRPQLAYCWSRCCNVDYHS